MKDRDELRTLTTEATSRRRLLGGILAGSAGIAALALGACGDDDNTGKTPAAGGSPAPSPQAAKEGGNLIVAAFADATTMDPHQTTSDDLALRSNSLFEGSRPRTRS